MNKRLVLRSLSFICIGLFSTINLYQQSSYEELSQSNGALMPKNIQNALLIVWVLLLLGGCAGNACAVSFIGPYPQNSKLDSIVISWKTTTATKQNEVHWGSSPLLGNVSKEKCTCAHMVHKVTISGLAASRQYYYTVVSDGTESPLYTFWTAFLPNETIRFVAYGDSQGDWDNWVTVLLVAQAIEKTNPAFVIKPGDLVDNGRNPDDWIDFFTASPFIHNSTLFPVLGNHESYSPLFFTYFSLPSNERWYSFDNGPLHFIGLDSNIRNRYRLRQLLWLIHDLQNHHQAFTIVFFHHPPYSSSNHGNTTILQKLWVPLFERYHVDIVFNGHDHNYERSIINNVTYLVIGGGGSPLYDNGQSPWTVYSEKTYHFCLLMVNETTLTCEAIKPDGLVFDSFLLTTH